MDDLALSWLLQSENPAVAYRTERELLGKSGDKEPVLSWLFRFLPEDWKEAKGLWSTYWMTAIAECGLTFRDLRDPPPEWSACYDANPFDCGCGDFMRLRAMVCLGLPIPENVLTLMRQKQLPDGGFLCLHRLDKLKYTPKSCVKANMHALLFAAECKKRGIELAITDALLEYFWKHRIFYRTDDPAALILNAREGWRTVDVFYPFEVMRVGLSNVVEAFCALGYGADGRLEEAWRMLEGKTDAEGRTRLDGTLSKSYLPKERVGKPSRWATFYTLLARKEAGTT